ncbi:MAG: hypothetical protein AAF950_18110 [Pseudomonadota bacterium]
MDSLDLDVIKKRNESPGFDVDQRDVSAMIAEIERLRTIEDAAIVWSKSPAARLKRVRDKHDEALWQTIQDYSRSKAPE